MSGPYRVVADEVARSLVGAEAFPGGIIHDAATLEAVRAFTDRIATALRAAYAAGLAARGGREAEPSMTEIFEAASREFESWPEWKKQAARALTPTEDREYQIAVEKLMKEPG